MQDWARAMENLDPVLARHLIIVLRNKDVRPEGRRQKVCDWLDKRVPDLLGYGVLSYEAGKITDNPEVDKIIKALREPTQAQLDAFIHKLGS